MAQSQRQKRSPLAGKTATVWIERNGAGIKIEDVPATQAAVVLADMLSAFRALEKNYPELTQDLAPIGGGYPVPVGEDDPYPDESRQRRVGFTA